MKLSKFNFYTTNTKGELLLFNTLVGTKSFIKIHKTSSNMIEDVLKRKCKLEDVPNECLKILREYGYVIEDDVNEDDYINKIYVDKVADSKLELTLLSTEQCNFRCRYCYESFPDRVMTADVQEAILKYIRRNIGKYSSLHISWFGGEPLLELNTIEYLSENIKKICAHYKKPYSASMTTNGYLLDLETFKRLLNCNLIYYQITIDGTKDIHDYQRPHVKDKMSTYDKVISNLIDIKSEIKNNNFRVTLRSNFSKLHFNRIDEYKKSLFEIFGNDKRFQFFVRPVMDWGGETIDNFKDKLIDSCSIKTMYDNIMSSDVRLNFIYDDFLESAGGMCEAAKKNSYVINTDGSIYKCTCDFDNQSEAKIGKISKNGEFILDESRVAAWLCNMSNCNENCFYAPICLRDACPAIRVLHKSNTKKCPLEKRELSKILQLLDIENNMFKEIII